MEQAKHQRSPIAVYWQPGCTSCLRTKEFLTKNGVEFESRNVLTDTDAFNELAKLGLRQIPIVTLNGQWADGQVLADVAKLVGIRHGQASMIAPADLLGRARRVQAGAARFLAQVPDDKLYTMQPNRPRSYADLGYHIFSLADAFLEHERGIPLTFDAYNRYTTPGNDSREQILAYGNPGWHVQPSRRTPRGDSGRTRRSSRLRRPGRLLAEEHDEEQGHRHAGHRGPGGGAVVVADRRGPTHHRQPRRAARPRPWTATPAARAARRWRAGRPAGRTPAACRRPGTTTRSTPRGGRAAPGGWPPGAGRGSRPCPR